MMARSVLLLLCSTAAHAASARLPPMGWRSWFQYTLDMNETIFRGTADALTDRSRKVNGKPTSLLDLGYEWVAQDDGWQGCKNPAGHGSGGFHNDDGSPRLNTTKWPDMKSAVTYAKAKGLRPEWYLNNCWCADPSSDHKYFVGDVDFVVGNGWEGVKIDGCGGERDIQLFHDLLVNRSGDPDFFIEDCHDARSAPAGVPRAPPNATWCPFSMWRNSYDYRGTLFDTAIFLLNMQTKNNANVSRPGCWAHAGMLAVGVNQSSPDGFPWAEPSPMLTYLESESHFGMWCIVSSPLQLSFSPFDASAMDLVWPIITNTEAIAINQAWAGDPGHLLTQSEDKVALWCFMQRREGNATCYFPSWQVWTKQLPGGSHAVLLLNNGDSATDVAVTWAELGVGCTSCAVRDVWARKDIGAHTGGYTAAGLPSHGTAFIVVSPNVSVTAA